MSVLSKGKYYDIHIIRITPDEWHNCQHGTSKGKSTSQAAPHLWPQKHHLTTGETVKWKFLKKFHVGYLAIHHHLLDN